MSKRKRHLNNYALAKIKLCSGLGDLEVRRRNRKWRAAAALWWLSLAEHPVAMTQGPGISMGTFWMTLNIWGSLRTLGGGVFMCAWGDIHFHATGMCWEKLVMTKVWVFKEWDGGGEGEKKFHVVCFLKWLHRQQCTQKRLIVKDSYNKHDPSVNIITQW